VDEFGGLSESDDVDELRSTLGSCRYIVPITGNREGDGAYAVLRLPEFRVARQAAHDDDVI
jgi:hypothetical protein